ncbi:MAG: hypothetical protein LJE70_16940 [Chromatiaceae bacterium]|nr:hypothetical protein [Chromatiaceae bacterium]
MLDNCPRETHDAIAPVCKSSGSTLSLVTVDLNIRDDKLEDTDVFRLQNASEAVIESLLERRYPSLSQAVRRRIAEFSDGNAGIAILSAQHVGPDTNLAHLGDEGLFERLFRQRKQADDRLLGAAEALALVYSFDGETFDGERAELTVLSEIAGLDVHAVGRAVGELKRRDIVQSRGRWRAILPQPLANWLAKRALENQPALGIADAFWRCGNPRLLKSFTHRLSYLHDSVEAQQIAKAWLNPGGHLSDLRDLSWSSIDIRVDLVRHLAPVAPSAALDLIERFVLGSTLDRLTAREYPVRHPAMSLLRKLAWFPENFRRVALLLSRFVQADLSEGDRNQDTRYLEELFWPVLSGTRAGPEERLAVVEEQLSAPESPSQETGMIALRGMLNAGDFISSHDFSFGGRAIDHGWHPKTLADYRAWYGGALAVAKRLATSDSPLRKAARSAIAEHFRSLWCLGHVFEELEEAAVAIGMAEHWPEGWLAVRKTIALDAERMEVGLVARLQTLAEHLAPARFGERVRSYVLTPAHAVADLAHWETAEDYSHAHQAVIDKARQLGRECGGDLVLLEGLWPEIFGPNAHQATWFGKGLAETVVHIPEIWGFLLDRYEATDDGRRNPVLLGGFLRSAALKDKGLVEGILDAAVSDPILGPVFPYLQAVVGFDEAGFLRLVASIETGLAPPKMHSTRSSVIHEPSPATNTVFGRRATGMMALNWVITHLPPRENIDYQATSPK